MTTTLSPIHITSTAIAELKRLRAENNLDENAVLRIGVKGGGCSGMSYLLAFDQQTESDNLYEVEGIHLVMNKAHEMYLLGMEVNWEDGLNSRGFTFTNPNAKSTCGCGTSFSV